MALMKQEVFHGGLVKGGTAAAGDTDVSLQTSSVSLSVKTWTTSN